ncbi:hypothetical protein ARMSODRAFT_536406 [Armillaria solidipes]|uniref:Secreted protein n=1 Tax=Armillaria solidipes TaxID=1076256 RepID=A0A2H3BI15_9AGAR|nr:hypothetical protein ARMSODRAFT_536406 [Armillaria solidipes]
MEGTKLFRLLGVWFISSGCAEIRSTSILTVLSSSITIYDVDGLIYKISVHGIWRVHKLKFTLVTFLNGYFRASHCCSCSDDHRAQIVRPLTLLQLRYRTRSRINVALASDRSLYQRVLLLQRDDQISHTLLQCPGKLTRYPSQDIRARMSEG